MAFTAQQIADFYDQQVGGGKMNEAAFVDLARANGISDTLLTQARDVAVDRQIPTMTQPQVIAALTERAQRGGPLQVTQQVSSGEGGGVSYVAPGGLASMGGIVTPTFGADSEGAAGALTGFERILTPQFDPRYAGGQYGQYVGTYDPAGNLREVTFRQGERHGGFLNENMDTIANMAIMALSGIPNLLAPTLGTIGAGAAVGAGSGILGTLADGGSVGQAALRGGISGGISAAAGNILRGLFATDAVGSDWSQGRATGAPGGLLPTNAAGLTAANMQAAPFEVDGSDWARGQPTGPTGGLLPTTAGGLTAANNQAAPDIRGNGAWLGENVPSGVDAWDDAFRRAGGVFDDGWVSNMLDTQLDQNFERPSYDDFTRDTMNEWNNMFRAEPLGDGEDINGRSLYDDTRFDLIDEDPTGNNGPTFRDDTRFDLIDEDPAGNVTDTGGTGNVNLRDVSFRDDTIFDLIGGIIGGVTGPIIERVIERERPPTTTTPTPTATYVNPQTAEQAVRPTGPAVVGGAAGSIPGVAETLLTGRIGEDPLMMAGRRSVALGRR